jgi:hypothetical protein
MIGALQDVKMIGMENLKNKGVPNYLAGVV